MLSVYVAVPPGPGELRIVEPRLHSMLKPARARADFPAAESTAATS